MSNLKRLVEDYNQESLKGLDYNIHCTSDEFGMSVNVMLIGGVGFGRLWIDSGDRDTVYLDGLSVDYECRNLGIGTDLQLYREGLARSMGFKESTLRVKKDSWMYNWYIRRGYVEKCEDVENEGYIFMCKDLTIF